MYQIFFEIFLLLFNWQGIKSINNTAEIKNKIKIDIKNKSWANAELKLNKIIINAADEPEIFANLGFVLFKQNKIVEAEKIYTKIIDSKNVQVALEAEFQLGFIHCIKGDTALAIKNFENALRKDFKHELARNNLEVLNEKFKTKASPISNKTMQNTANQTITSNIKQELDPVSDKEAELERLKKINLTEAQIKSIFDALASTEKKYIQQRKIKVKENSESFQTW